MKRVRGGGGAGSSAVTASNRRAARIVLLVAFIAGVAPTASGGIVASSPDARLRLSATFNPPALGAGSAQFSFLMWLQRSHAEPQPLHLVDVPGAFAVLVDGADESIRSHVSGAGGILEIVLPLRDGSGSVPLDEWILIAASWDAAEGRFEGWARAESVGPVHDVVIEPAFVRSAPLGLPSLGRPDITGAVAQQGHYGLMVFRDHAIDGSDIEDLWAERDYLGPYRLDNVDAGGNLTGTVGACWMANHAILTTPAPYVIGTTSPALLGHEVAEDNFCAFSTSYSQSSFFTAAPVVEAASGPDAFVFGTPYESPGVEAFFVRKIPTIEVPLDPPYVSGVSPVIRRAVRGAPQGLVRCLVSANSRGTRLSPQGQTWPENYAHGFFEARLEVAAGVLNRPARLSANLPWFGFDTTVAPAHSGSIESFPWSAALRGFARLWSGSAGASVGPGSGIWMDDGAVYALKCRPEPGSLIVATAPLVIRAHVLRFPGAGTVQWRPVQAAGQHHAGTSGAASPVDLGSPAPYAHTLTPQDLVDAALSRLVLSGDHRPGIQAGDACYVSDGPGSRGFSVVSAVSGDGQTTEVVFEHWFGDDPAAGSTILAGPWEIVTIAYEWPALEAADDAVWRGLELTAVGGPVVNFAWDAWRPDVDGIAFGIAGWAGNGYTPQMQESFAAAIPAWIGALEPDLWLQGLAQQGSSPSSMSDYLACIQGARPGIEVAWIADGEHGLGNHQVWDQYILDHASAAGVIAATLLEDGTVGTIADQCADALRSDLEHMSHRGNARLAERWLELLGVAALSAADLDGDGVVGVGDFLQLLAAWGPCPVPPDPCSADLDGDGGVGVADFLILLGEWGP